MAGIVELEVRVKNLEDIIQAAVFLPKFVIKWNDPEVVAGSKVYGQDGSLFGGDNFFADVVNAPVSGESDLTNVFRY